MTTVVNRALKIFNNVGGVRCSNVAWYAVLFAAFKGSIRVLQIMRKFSFKIFVIGMAVKRVWREKLFYVNKSNRLIGGWSCGILEITKLAENGHKLLPGNTFWRQLTNLAVLTVRKNVGKIFRSKHLFIDWNIKYIKIQSYEFNWIIVV